MLLHGEVPTLHNLKRRHQHLPIIELRQPERLFCAPPNGVVCDPMRLENQFADASSVLSAFSRR